MYKNHKVRDLEEENETNKKENHLKDFQKLKEYSRCSVHPGMELKFFCKDDESACCATCAVIYHRQCDDVIEMQDDRSGQEAKAEIEKMKSSIDKLSTFGKRVVEIKRKALLNDKKQIEKIRDTLHDVREKINKTLDLLDESVTEQTKAIMKKQSLNEDNGTEALNKLIERLQNYSTLVETAIQCGSTNHFYGIRQNMKEQIGVLEISILDVCEAFTNAVVELRLETPLQSLLDIEPFAANKLITIVERETQIQLPTNEGNNFLRNFKVVKASEKSLKENYRGRDSPTFSDIIFLSNNCLVLVDRYNGFCCLANKEYEIISSCDIRVENDKRYRTVPYFCTSMHDGKIAVSAPGQRKLFILKGSIHLNIAYEIHKKYTPRAIHGLKNGDIAVAWDDPVAFGVISNTEIPIEKTHFSTDTAGRKMKSFEYITVDEARKQVIQPCTVDKAVYCFNFEGCPKFKYTYANLENPKGVALDKDGNIYACSYSESAIHVISPTGQSIRIVKEGCPNTPLAIAFKKNGKEFAVTNCTEDRLLTFFKQQQH